MIDSKLEILEGRVAELEKIIAKAPATTPDERIDKIIDVLKEEAVTFTSKTVSFSNESLKRGVRKVSNEFYRGPDAAAITLKKELDKAKADLRQALHENETLRNQYVMMKQQLENIRYMLNHPEYEIDVDGELGKALRRQEE